MLLHFSSTSPPASHAPTRTHGRTDRTILWASNEAHPIEVNRLPVVSMYAEVQTLVSAPTEYHQRATVLGHLDHSQPELIPNLRGDASTEHPGRDLEKPPSHMPTQAHRACGENEYYHGGSSE
jgi:hypothetical protein